MYILGILAISPRQHPTYFVQCPPDWPPSCWKTVELDAIATHKIDNNSLCLATAKAVATSSNATTAAYSFLSQDPHCHTGSTSTCNRSILKCLNSLVSRSCARGRTYLRDVNKSCSYPLFFLSASTHALDILSHRMTQHAACSRSSNFMAATSSHVANAGSISVRLICPS